MNARLLFLVMLAACNKTPAARPSDAGPTVLEPMENPDPPKPSASTPTPGPAAWALSYTDDMDLPPGAGLDRCSIPGVRNVTVRVDLAPKKKSVSLVIPETGYKKQLWDPNHKEPAGCSITPGADAVRFFCSDDLTSTAGKVYTRGSDVVLGVNSFDGKRQEVIPLPCGSKARFEAPVAPTPAPSR